jgi:beta-fructofuranosidase
VVSEVFPLSDGFFRPAGAWVGDVIPFRQRGRFWLFYLYEARAGGGMPWALVSTTDFVRFHDHGVVLPSGGEEAPDFNAYTGSVVIDGDTAHLFYTGHNPHRVGPDGQP